MPDGSGASPAAPSGPLPPPVPDLPATGKQETIEALRRRIQALERGVAAGAPVTNDAGPPAATVTRRATLEAWAPDDGGAPWTFGDVRLDGLLPAGALDRAALHEIKPHAYGDWPAAALLALRLAVRRLGDGGGQLAPWPEQAAPRILWCQTSARAGDLGRLHAPGLAALGLAPESLIEVEASRVDDVLWAMEEGLASAAVALVVGSVDEVALTPSRRLGLAAAAGRTPCLLLSAPGTAAAPSAATRWRIGRQASAGHPFDRLAPGPARLALSLERCRGAPPLADAVTTTVEWCDGTRAFRVVAGLAARLSGTEGARRRAG